jgi:4-hydroxy-tetrahydrodipicolinate synthase
VAAATDREVVLYNIPSRSVIDMPDDLLAELGQVENVTAVKQARRGGTAPIDGLDLLAGNDDMLADVLDAGGAGGILVASHLVGPEMRAMIDQPERRRELHDALMPLFEALAVTTGPIPVKAALGMLGRDVGGLRLPLVEASQDEREVIRTALERHGLLSRV